MSELASSQTGETSNGVTDNSIIPPALKFVVSNLKTLVPTQLSTDNYSIWRCQVIKLFRANGFEQFLDSATSPPSPTIHHIDGSTSSNPAFNTWKITDQNLAASLCSTISPSVLPYVLHLELTSDIWKTLETRFQATNRSKVIQLKNELHNISMKSSSMTQYLNEVKLLVDQIAAAGSSVDVEDIILYILNGLPPQYLAFKTSIRTMLTPISLDALYSLLISEEIHLNTEASRTASVPDQTTALYTNRGCSRRNRGRFPSSNDSTKRPLSNQSISCQICSKKGHLASDCWHWFNLNYSQPPPNSTTNRAMVAATDNSQESWFLDSGASSHMTNNSAQISNAQPYYGSDGVTVGDGRSLPITHSGLGILPTPTRFEDQQHNPSRPL